MTLVYKVAWAGITREIARENASTVNYWSAHDNTSARRDKYFLIKNAKTWKLEGTER